MYTIIFLSVCVCCFFSGVLYDIMWADRSFVEFLLKRNLMFSQNFDFDFSKPIELTMEYMLKEESNGE
jgi:hypothetical protein